MNRSLPRRITRENNAILRVVARHDLNRTAIPGKLAGERSSATPKPPAEASDAKDQGRQGRQEEDPLVRGVAGSERPGVGAPRPARARPGRDAGQPPRRPRAAGLDEVPDRRRHRQGAAPSCCGRSRRHRRRDAHRGGRPRSRCRRSSASRHRRPSPRCAARCRSTSRTCRCATSTRRRPASSSRA